MSSPNGRAQVKRLQLANLMIDKRYQRPLSNGRVAKIASDFDPVMCGVLEVSTRSGGKYAVLDGQHRLAGLQILNETEWDCRIHESLTAREEAALFVKLQTERKAVEPIYRHKAHVFQGDALAVKVDNLVNETGYRITANRVYGALTCVVGLYRAHERYGPEALRGALQITESVWGVNDTFSRKGPMVVGLALLLHKASKLKQFDVESFKQRLANIKSASIIRDSQTQGSSHSTDAQRVAMQLLDIYNKGRTTGRLTILFASSS